MNLSVAVSSDWGIGYENDLLFRIPDDLNRFRELTLNKVVVMGHNTYKSLPKNRRPLPNRVNIVLSRDISLEIPGVLTCGSIEALEILLKNFDEKNIFLIGGEKLYVQLLNRCERAYITKVEASPPADAFMPNIDKLPEWNLKWESCTKKHGDLAYKFSIYTNELFFHKKSLLIS